MTGVFITNEIPPLPFGTRLDEATIKQAKAIRWQWYLLYNRVRSQPWTAASEAHLARCDEAIAIIDALLAANVTTH
jgi:hypothetical protein